MMDRLRNWFFKHTLMEGGRDYFSERHIRSSKLTLNYGALTVLLFSSFEYNGHNIDAILLWALPLLIAIFANSLSAKVYLETKQSYVMGIFIFFELWAFICWVSYVFIFSGEGSSADDITRRSFLIFVVTLFYLNAMQYSMILLIANSSIVCSGILIHTLFFTGKSPEELQTFIIIIVLGWFLLLRFGRAAYLLMCENYKAIAENKRLMTKMDDMLVHDALTQQHNRRYFEEQLDRQMAIFNRDHNAFCLALLDIDYFKKVNDEYGHQIGDAVLIELARVVRLNLRESDVFARYGGEEFAIILPISSVDAAVSVLNKVRQTVERHDFFIDNYSLPVTISIGLTMTTNGDDAKLLVKRADDALYRAKAHGRNRLEIQ